MRLFLALDLPPEIKHHLSDLQQSWLSTYTKQQGGHLRDVSLTKAQNLHVTLKFLGEVPDPALPALISTLQELPSTSPLTLHIAGLTYFPPRGPIRILATTLAGDTDRLYQTYSHLESLCQTQGFPREHRPFHPHITLARSRTGLPPRLRTTTPPTPDSPAFSTPHITLFQSHLKPTGPDYIPLATFPL